MAEYENGMFRETVVQLPYFKNIGNQQIFTIKYYNFGIDGNDDWQPYTPITTADELNDDDATRSGNYVLMNDIVIPEGELSEMIIIPHSQANSAETVTQFRE